VLRNANAKIGTKQNYVPKIRLESAHVESNDNFQRYHLYDNTYTLINEVKATVLTMNETKAIKLLPSKQATTKTKLQ